MYRHSAASMATKTNGFLLPSPAHDDQSTSESESETITELGKKRKQVDEEIALFKAQKEKEFHDFEQDLQKKRKRKRTPANGGNHLARTPPTDPSVLSLLGSRPQANGHADRLSLHHAQRPNSKPTLSVEKLTIVGTTVTPATAEDPPNALARSLSGAATPPRPHNEKTPILPPTPYTENNTKQEPPLPPIARDNNETFAGVFTPSYLPLLDSRTSRTNSIPQTPTKPHQLSQSDPTPQNVQPGSSSSSLPSSPISPRNPSPVKRSHTSPLLPSTSLPSALRNDSARTKKRKHVTFRLADSAVVEPSSSYEEMSSPDLPSENSSTKGKVNGGIDSVLVTEEVPWSWNKGPISPIVEKGDAMNLCGDGEEEIWKEQQSLTVSNTVNGDSHETTPIPSGLSFDEAADGGSGVGFFELEEELDSPSLGISPSLRSPRSDRRFFDDWGAIPDEDVDEEIGKDQRVAEARGEETQTTEEDLAEEMLGDDEEKSRSVGLGIASLGAHGERGSTFASGSVPIDIVVRPSSSWVGSLRAGSMTRESSYIP